MGIIEKLREANYVIIGVAFLLFLIGLVGLSSIAIHQDDTIQTSSFLKQIYFFFPGFVLCIIMFYLPKSIFHKYSYLAYGFIILAILVPFTGEKIAGTYRWIDIGPLGIQPSEFAKWIVVLVLARYLSDYNIDLNRFRTLIIPIIVVVIPTAIVIKQSDLGSSIIILSSLIPMIYWSRVNPYFIFLLIGPIISILTASHSVSFTIWGISMIGILYVVCPNLIRGVITYFSFLLFGLFSPWIWSLLSPYQQKRILTLLNPELDPLGSAYQLIQSQTAIGSGGLFGKGWGNGTQTHLKFLPVQESDFMISVLGEEMGFGFIAVLFCLFALLIFQILKLASESNDRFSSLILIGLGTIILSHIFVNTAMAVGLIPVKGLPLPFISAGGSFLLSCFMMIGLILNMGVNTFE
ncbi:MAG: FtsW/RodA/SpoVE family cell cycle protein [Candidatus Marinimicrobia bacterium]|jgi:rod shape determining protein RodA|nr:FtsW/RodA/SpoVE family cell cycle protein [Candidatus Neomarinimicrobiota bacterium]|tara:strand:+ start:17008 stop:18228 length:1221 start_codon:yes stop_codon:yes gene_type:complete